MTQLPSPSWRVVLRSYVFLVLIILLSGAFALLLPFMVLPRSFVRRIFHAYLRIGLWLIEVVCDVRYVVVGRENIPPGPVLFASKHQSAWDSAVLPMLLGDPAAFVKREFLLAPIMGLVAWRMRHIPVARGKGVGPFAKAVETARQTLAEGRSILIFPEGTRRCAAPYAKPDYHKGVAVLFQQLKAPCVPVALNSGLVWPRRSILRPPGVIRVEILPLIPASTERTAFMGVLIDRIETASRRLAGVEASRGEELAAARC